MDYLQEIRKITREVYPDAKIVLEDQSWYHQGSDMWHMMITKGSLAVLLHVHGETMEILYNDFIQKVQGGLETKVEEAQKVLKQVQKIKDEAAKILKQEETP